MKTLNWLLYEVHRWLGIVLSIFMFVWFATGIVIMYANPTTQNRGQQLAHAEILRPDPGWLSLGEVWKQSAEQRKTAAAERKVKNAEMAGPVANNGGGRKAEAAPLVAEARLQRIAGEPVWLVDDSKGLRYAISAVDGNLRETSASQAIAIAENWFKAEKTDAAIAVSYLESVENPVILRNQDTLRPFHHVTTDDGRELLISSRTGEVLHASTSLDRTLFLAGNWLHLFKPLESMGLGSYRHDVQLWSGLLATVACLTGMIIGWLRWRPGIGGRKTYSEGRTQPYRQFWYKWHFWTGLIGGTVALCWALSGFIDTNPWKWFTTGDYSKEDLSAYLGNEFPENMRDWRPDQLTANGNLDKVAELSWRRLGGEAILLGYQQDGQKAAITASGSADRFSDQAFQSGVLRLAATATIAESRLLTDYDAYYYPRHHQGLIDRPLPVQLYILKDPDGSRIYIDPNDGRLLYKMDQSRQVFRWLYSALHHWDFGWLYYRPVWDVWMLTWIGFGLVLGASSLVIAWKRLKKTFAPKKHKVRQNAGVVGGELATETAE